MIIKIELGERSYDVVIERGCLGRAAELLDTDRKCLIVTDEGVPGEYAGAVAAQCLQPLVVSVPAGEQSKSFANAESLIAAMSDNGFTRKDCVIAVGGGMPGDLAGFAAAAYMRGIDFYNIPTTLLSQADSSVGGKTAVNVGGYKNIAGAFWQPRKVLIDTDTLETLSADQTASGMAEIIKAGMIADAELFGMFERGETAEAEDLLVRALMVKKTVVEADEREAGLRRMLNFGHTIGHGIESVTGMLHGHCVAAGMVPMCSGETRKRLKEVLRSAGLPCEVKCSPDAIYEAVLRDKKMSSGMIGAVVVDEPGSCRIEDMTPEELRLKTEEVCVKG